MDSHDVIPQTEYKQTDGHFSKCHTEKNRHFLRKLCYYNLIWNIFKGTLLLSKSPAAPTMKPKHGLDTSVAFAPQHWAPAILTHLGFFFTAPSTIEEHNTIGVIAAYCCEQKG